MKRSKLKSNFNKEETLTIGLSTNVNVTTAEIFQKSFKQI